MCTELSRKGALRRGYRGSCNSADSDFVTLAAAAPSLTPLAPSATPGRLAIPERVGGLLKATMTALAQRRWGEGIELTAAAAVQDIQQEAMTFLAGAAGAGILGELYEQAFRGAADSGTGAAAGAAWLRGPGVSPRHARAGSGPLRVLYVTPGLSDGQAATDRLIHVVEQHDRSRVMPLVLSTEEFTARTPPLKFLEWPSVPADRRGPLIERLSRAGVEPVIAPTVGGFLPSSTWATAAARQLAPDVAVFIASSACPVQAGMALARVAPVQLNQNIGTPLVIRGIDGVIYRNLERAAADRSDLSRRGIRTIELPAAGTDLGAAERATPVPRHGLRIPPNAPVLASASNKLPQRLMLGGFADDLIAFLASHPGTWWMGVGDGDFSAFVARCRDAGVASRIALVGGQADIRPYLKACDLYVNEYPEGGSNSVMEAMACGVPVVAMDAGPGHCESIGAQICGEAIGRGETGVYWQRVAMLCEDRDARAAAAARAKARATEKFGFAALVRQYETCYQSEWERAGA